MAASVWPALYFYWVVLLSYTGGLWAKRRGHVTGTDSKFVLALTSVATSKVNLLERWSGPGLCA